MITVFLSSMVMLSASVPLFQDSVFFGVLISLAAYAIGMLLED